MGDPLDCPCGIRRSGCPYHRALTLEEMLAEKIKSLTGPPFRFGFRSSETGRGEEYVFPEARPTVAEVLKFGSTVGSKDAVPEDLLTDFTWG